MKNILSLILRYFSFLLCGLLFCAVIYYLYLFDRTVVLTGFSQTITPPYPPFSVVFPILPIAAVPLGILVCFCLCLSFTRKARVHPGEGFCAVVFHAATWLVLFPACFHFAAPFPLAAPQGPLSAGYFRPAGPGEILFFTNINPDRGFVLNTLTGDARRVSSFDETETLPGGETSAREDADTSPFRDPLVAERLIPPFWLTAFGRLLSTLFKRLSAAYSAGIVPWLFAATPCFPLSAMVVTIHLSRQRFANFCRVVFNFLRIIACNIAWVYFDLDTFFRPVANSLIDLLPAGIVLPEQSISPGLVMVNLLLGLFLCCRGFIGAVAHRKKGLNYPAEAFS